MEQTSEYKKIYNDFQELKALSTSISSLTFNKKCNKYEKVASLVFTKNLAHIYSLDKLLPNLSKQNELWDLSSLSTIARSIIDAYYVMYYIAFDSIEDKQKEFRFLLFQYHSEKSRLEMLKSIKTEYKLDEIENTVRGLLSELERNKYFAKLDNNVKSEIKKGKKSRLLSNSDISEIVGIDKTYYKLVFNHLSNYVHTFPFAINELSTFRAGTQRALDDIGLLLQYVVSYLALCIEGFSLLDISKNHVFFF